jgi:hypothetical protein
MHRIIFRVRTVKCFFLVHHYSDDADDDAPSPSLLPALSAPTTSVPINSDSESEYASESEADVDTSEADISPETFTPEELQIQELGSQILNKFMELSDALALRKHIPDFLSLFNVVSNAMCGFHLQEHALKFEPLSAGNFLLRKSELCRLIQKKLWMLDAEFSFALACASRIFGFKRYTFSCKASSFVEQQLTVSGDESFSFAVASASAASCGVGDLASSSLPNVVAPNCGESLLLELDLDLAASVHHCWPN